MLCSSYVRKCPRCSVLVTRTDGCLHVLCPRCQYAFCWSCMGPLSRHSKCHRLCPELPWSMGVNIALSLLFLINLPLILSLGPLLYTLYMAICNGIPETYRFFRGAKKCRCFSAFIMTLLISLIAIIPGSLLGGTLASAIITAVGIIPLTFWTISYLLRVCYHYSRILCCA